MLHLNTICPRRLPQSGANAVLGGDGAGAGAARVASICVGEMADALMREPVAAADRRAVDLAAEMEKVHGQ